jgi:hypothetical protein
MGEEDRFAFRLWSDNDVHKTKTVKVTTALMFLQLLDPTGNAHWSSDKKAKVVTTANNAGGGHMSGLLLLCLT